MVFEGGLGIVEEGLEISYEVNTCITKYCPVPECCGVMVLF